MPFLNFNGKQLEVNEEGFLSNPDEWNKEVAAFLAKEEEGIDALNDQHWSVINFIREYYLDKNLAPMVRLICKTTGLKLREILVKER